MPAQFNGKVLFQLLAQFNGPANFNGQVTFNSDAGGTAFVKRDSQKVSIRFSKDYTVKPVIIANWLFNDTKDGQGGISDSSDAKQQRILDGGFSFSVANISTKGFDIILNKRTDEDIQFDWVATAIKNSQLSQSTLSSNP